MRQTGAVTLMTACGLFLALTTAVWLYFRYRLGAVPAPVEDAGELTT